MALDKWMPRVQTAAHERAEHLHFRDDFAEEAGVVFFHLGQRLRDGWIGYLCQRLYVLRGEKAGGGTREVVAVDL